MKMTKAQFVTRMTKILQESYPSLTGDFVATETDKLIAGQKPTNVIAMFIAPNLEKVELDG